VSITQLGARLTPQIFSTANCPRAAWPSVGSYRININNTNRSISYKICIVYHLSPDMSPIKFNILLLLSRSIFATGLNELSPTTLRDVAKYLHPVGTQALSSSSKGLNGWSRKLVLNKVKNFEHLDCDSSWKLVSSLIAEVAEHFSDVAIYPMTLTFHQDDVPLLKELDVLSFLRRVQTVVFEGDERMVIEAKHSQSEIADIRHGGATQSDIEISDDVPSHILPRLDIFNFIRRVQSVLFDTGYFQWLGSADVCNGASIWSMEMYDPKAAVWAWNQPHFLFEVLESHTVTAVKSLCFSTFAPFYDTADLVVELAWSVTAGDMNWTATKTCPVHDVQLEGISAEEILLNQKLRFIQALKLTEFDRSVLANVFVLAHLKNLESLSLFDTNVVDVSALAKLTNLKSLDVSCAELLDVPTLS
jgi:hypothetical protein